MKKLSISCLIALSLLIGGYGSANAVESFSTPTGVLHWEKQKAFNGYTLVSPSFARSSYLVDMEGNVVHEWKTNYFPGLYAELLPNGNLLRAFRYDKTTVPFGGSSHGVQELTWDGKVVWEYKIDDPNFSVHHCFKRMPNGNTLILVWERKSADEAYEKGRIKGTLPGPEGDFEHGKKYNDIWPDSVVEIDKQGNKVWSWHVWDHLGTGEKEFNINYILPTGDYMGSSDWTHFNTIDYIPETNQIVLCSRNFGEVFIIDKATGEMVYRWGNPSTHGKGIAPSWINANDQQLFGPHHTTWLGDGKIMIFDNGWQNPEHNRSRVIILDTKQNKVIWEYKAENLNSFYSAYQGAAQQLPNGNVLVTSTNTGHVFEVTGGEKPEVVWEYVLPWVAPDKAVALLTEKDSAGVHINIMKNSVHRTYRYGADYEGLKGKNLPKGKPLFPNAPKWYEVYPELRNMQAK